MPRPRVRVGLAALAGLLACSLQALGGQPSSDPVEERIDILKDLNAADDARARARNELVGDPKLTKLGSLEKLIALGGAAKDANVRLHVAIALGSVRRAADRKKLAAAIPMLQGWMNAKDNDTALHYWAALAIANSRQPGALKIVATCLTDADNPVVCDAVARSIGRWQQHKATLPLLVGMLAHKQAQVRVAGIQSLQLTGVNEPAAVEPLAKIAGEDSEEIAWRAAERALNELAKGMPIRRMLIRVGAPKAERKEVVRIWLFEWRRAKRLAAKAGKG